MATPYRSSYAAAKHALRAFYDSMRAEIHDSGVRVSVVYPGFVKTAISLSALVGDGTTQNKMDDAQDAGMSAEEFAKQTVKALAKGQDHIVMVG